MITVLQPPGLLDAFALADECERRAAARDALREQIPENARESCVTHEQVLGGATADALLTYASGVHAELIVMDRGDRRHLHGLWLGSTAGRLMRAADCPILIVPPPSKPDDTRIKPVAESRNTQVTA